MGPLGSQHVRKPYGLTELISSMVSIPASLKCCLSWNFDVCRCQASQVLHETGAAVLVGLLLVGMFEALGKHWRHWNWLECWLVWQAYGPNRNSRRFLIGLCCFHAAFAHTDEVLRTCKISHLGSTFRSEVRTKHQNHPSLHKPLFQPDLPNPQSGKILTALYRKKQGSG